MPENYDVFLSYSRADGKLVHRLAENLHNAGLRVFLDEWEIGPGDVVNLRLDAAILKSRNGVLCISPTALSRPWVQEEYAALLNRAVEKKLRLIPVLLADAELPAFLATRAWVDLRTADGPEYERKIRDLVAALKGERLGAPPRRDGEILPKPGTAFRAEGPLQGRLRIGASAVAYLKDGAPAAEHSPKGLSDRTKFRLWNLDRARHGHLPEDAQLRDAAGAGTAAPPSALHALLLEIGDALTREFLAGAAGEALRREVQDAERLGFPLELGLEIEDGLADLPWETLRLPARDGVADPPLAIHPHVRLFRATAGLGSSPALPIPGPLRILVAIGSPEEQNARGELLDMERELSRILDAVEPARKLTPKQHRPAYVRVIERGTAAAIREALQIERFHVLHVTCHAGPGELVLEKEDGSADPVDARRFCDEVLPPGRGVPLVVLAGCATALNVSGGQGEAALPGLARQLLARGVPAVLAMQAPVSDLYATHLGARLYRALATFETPDPLAALAEARRTLETDRQDAKLPSPVDLAEWATPALYLRGPSLPLYDPEEPFDEIQPPAEPRFGKGVVVRRVGEFVGRRREERRILQALRNPDGAGVLLHGLGGVGKSSLSAEVLKNLSEDGWVIATTFGKISPDDLLAEVGQRLLLQFQKEGVSEADPRRRQAVEIKRLDLDWEDRFQALSEHLLGDRPLIVLLDNFEDNFAPGDPAEDGPSLQIQDEDLANLLATWLAQPGHSRLLITSRQPFELPEDAHEILEPFHLGPLSFAETRKLIWRLPALDALSRDDQLRAYAEVGGHPRALEYLDALLRGGQARFPDISRRLKGALEKKGIENPKAWLSDVKGDLDRALAETVTLAVDDVLLEGLLERLKGIPQAKDLLVGASVYQVPVDLVGLAWQMGEEVEVPENSERAEQFDGLRRQIQETLDRGEKPAPKLLKQAAAILQVLMRPPLRLRHKLGPVLEVLLDLGLLAPMDDLYFVHRWTATALRGRYSVKVCEAHDRAARYWRWRVDNLSQSKKQDIEDLFQARHHYRNAGEVDAAVQVTEWICSQLYTWGAYRRDEQLCREVLLWLPENSREATAFSHELAILAQNRGDYDRARNWFQKVLHISEELGDRTGVARCYHQLGTVAQDRGDYPEAIDWYQKSLSISEKLGIQVGMAKTYGQLGDIAQRNGDYDQALDWYQKSLRIDEELNNQEGKAICYHKLGTLAQERGDNDQALEWYQKSLRIKEKMGNRAGMAKSYHQIGRILHERGDYGQAINWYQKALHIDEELGNRRELAHSFGQLAILLAEHGNPEESVPFTLRSLTINLQIGSPETEIDLHWLNRQQDLLGKERFGEILREHLSEEDAVAVLDMMARYSSEETKSGGSDSPEGTTA
ncbi:MAG TPA: tetratricopeptide repeat protein [Thermoanaerobaculia bacterium]|nr:tetratricopeptide repeat protein [Thermoanaerobaculia bacterium]